MEKLALYTTVHPGVRPFLKDWYRSVLTQTDREFSLWIGIDAMTVEDACASMGAEPEAAWVRGEPGDTPARIRQRAFERIVESCDALVLVDSDDVLHPTRIEAAREALKTSDLAGCALRLVDEGGAALGLTLGLPRGKGPDDVMPLNNVYGLSNTAYRSDLLKRCMPIPDGTVLVDWLLAARAWLYGARLAFDGETRMDYRQHGSNMVRVKPPFSGDQVVKDTECVRRHFRVLRGAPLPGAIAERLDETDRAAAEVEAFHERVVLRPDVLERYVHALDSLEPEIVWWWSVANPALKHLWT
mgnify:CR=1 FL=1